MLNLWKALVIPILDYCSQLWSPWTETDIRNIESVQRKLTHSTSEVRHLNYWKPCSLERRRERYMITYYWKITGIVPNIGITTEHHQWHDRSGEIRKLARESTVKAKTICSASLKVRGCSLFNILCKHIRNAENVTTNCFKKQLDRFLVSFPDQPCLPHYYKSAVSNSIIDQIQVTRRNPASHTTIGSGPPRPAPARDWPLLGGTFISWSWVLLALGTLYESSK